MNELREILKEVLNLGMNLRQDQLKGFSRKSGIETLDEYIESNKETLEKLLKIDRRYEVGQMVRFTDFVKDGYGFKTMVGKILNITEDKQFPYEIFVWGEGEGFIDYFDEFEFTEIL